VLLDKMLASQLPDTEGEWWLSDDGQGNIEFREVLERGTIANPAAN